MLCSIALSRKTMIGNWKSAVNNFLSVARKSLMLLPWDAIGIPLWNIEIKSGLIGSNRTSQQLISQLFEITTFVILQLVIFDCKNSPSIGSTVKLKRHFTAIQFEI